MNLTYNYNYITVANKAQTRERAKEFKKRYTDNDLLKAMLKAFGYREGLHGGETIVSCDVTVFEGNSWSNNYCVWFVLSGYKTMSRIHYYCDDELNVDMTNPLLRSFRRYKLVEEEN